MDFLNHEQLDNILKDAEIKASSEIINNEQIEEIKKLIKLKPTEEIGKGQCLFNAYQVAKITSASIVEGVAYVTAEKDGSESETYIKHAWNILDGNHFDFTKDFVWPNLSAEFKSINYLSAKEYSKDEYNLADNTLDFKSQVDLMSSSLKFLHTKEYVTIALKSLGLDKKFHEQLLNECINSNKVN